MKQNLLLLLIAAAVSCSAVKIDRNYTVRSQIKSPIPAEKTAEKELKTYLAKIFGPATENGKKAVILRYDSKAGREEFRISEDSRGNVIISGGRPRGVLYGSYYFLDRYLGVRWLTPEVEVVPKKSFVKIDRLDYHGKPSFNARILQTAQHRKKPVNSIRWSARNFINSGFANVFETDPDYGEELVFSPPASCHGLFHIIKPAMFFKDHPEFWALQDGKRTHRDKRGLTADYCLTNEKLARATAAECRKYLAKNPTARYISIQEGDFTRGYCECTPCKELVRKCGNRESGRWVFFANKVAKELKKDFPKTKLLIFAYTASRQPPENIKADDNVCVQLCAWNNRRGLPYDHPKNRGGRTLLKQMQQWKQVCKNILLWDYTYGYADRLMQTPDLLNNVENFKSFKKIGADGIFAENGVISDFSFCMPLRAWLLSRLMWNPDECGDGRELVRDFCSNYFGKVSGKAVADYYLKLCDINAKQKFVNVATGGGTIGNARFLSAPVTADSYLKLKKAFDEEKNPEYKVRLRRVLLPVEYQILRDYTNVAATGKIKIPQEQLANDILKSLDAEKTSSKGLIARMKGFIKSLLKLKNIKAKASILYSRYYPAQAYDGNLKTCWHAANGAGWCQIEFERPREISRITTVFGNYENIARGENAIQGSLNGKDFFDIIPRRKIRGNKQLHWVYTDDKLARPVKVKFVRTRCFSAFTKNNRRNDVVLQEQYFNLKTLPEELAKKQQ